MRGAVIAYRAGDLATAEANLCRLAPGNPEAEAWLGAVLMDRGSTREGMQALQHAADAGQAAADVEGRKADLARANLNLDYATIRAPIDGVVGAAQISEGALVVQNDSAVLATIQQLDPIYADFTQSVGELTRLRHAFETGDLERIAPDAIKVRLVLDDG